MVAHQPLTRLIARQPCIARENRNTGGMDIEQINQVYATFLPLILVAALWSAIWKGFALYRAGKVRDTGWFIALFILNTLGILEIIYLFAISKRESRRKYLDS